MTPTTILDQASEKVKSEVFGKLAIQIQSDMILDDFSMNLSYISMNTMSNYQHMLTVHDWHMEWHEEIDDKWYGTMTVKVSHEFGIDEEDALYAAACSLNDLNIVLDEIDCGITTLKVNDLSLDWTHIYSE